MQPVFLHVDMNSFFASCEQQVDISLRGKPIGVCEHLGGIIIAPSVEAKRWGIKTGTPVWDAKKLYPQIILRRVNARLYLEISRKFFTVLREYSNSVEEYSVDEAYVDLTALTNIKRKINGVWVHVDPFEEAERITKEIKQKIRSDVGDYMRVSVGVSYNRLLAKIASEMQKPDGLTVIRPGEEYKVYNTHRLTDIPGIGKRLAQRLKKFGIRTLIDLKNIPESHLITAFGIPGKHIYNLGQLQSFNGENSFASREVSKSVGHVYTIPAQFRFGGNVVPMLFRLCEKVAERMHKKNLMGSGVNVHIHGLEEHACYGSSHEVGEPFHADYFIHKYARQIIHKHFPVVESSSFIAKRIAITVFNMQPKVEQLGLFTKIHGREMLTEAMIKLHHKYGKEVLSFQPASQARHVFRESVGFRKKI